MRTRSITIHKQYFFLVFALGIITCHLNAQSFTFEHSECKVRVRKGSNAYLDKLFKSELEDNNFLTIDFIENKRFLAGELYATFEVKKGDEKLFKECTITVTIKKAKSSRPQKSDQLVFEKTNSRRVPRITFSGRERCSKAMKEAFIHIPKCVPIGFAGEKR